MEDYVNPILLTDSYKFSHWKQYPKGTGRVYSYFESRGGMFDETVFFGLQYYLKKYFSHPVTMQHVEEAQWVVDQHMGEGVFNREGWINIVKNHGGWLPVRIRAVPEGTVVPTSNVLFSIDNTDPAAYWLPNYMETVLH